MGGWTLEAAEQVCGQEEGGFDVLDLLSQLVEKSLVNAKDSGSDTRYSLLETTRQYAREKLFDSNEGEALHDRHAEYFLALAEQADTEIHGPRQLEWVNTLETEFDNFRTALEWRVSSGLTEQAARLFNSLNWANHLRGHYSEMSEWFEKITASPDIEKFPLQHAKMLNHIGSWEWLQGKFTEAHSHVSKSRSICIELGVEGEAELAWSLTYLGLITHMAGTDFVQSIRLSKEALQLHQKLGNQTGVAFSTLHLGVTQLALQMPEAKQTLERSLELYNRLGDLWGIARASQSLGSLFLGLGDDEKAQKYFEEHLRLDKKLGFKSGIAVAHDTMADLFRAQGKFTQAEEYYQKAIRYYIDYGMSYAYSLYGLSMLALEQDDYQLARKRFTELFQRTRASTEKMSACDFLMGLAAISAGLDQPQRAAKLYGAVQAILDSINYKYPGNDRNEFERHIQLAREQLAETFETFVNEGRLMTMEQAIAFALENDEG
jgi:tetratricopeptide (TPR) repeat protein